jgi:hypothetical protein
VLRSRVAGLALLAGALILPATPLRSQTAPSYDRYSLLWLAYFGDHAIAKRVALIGDVQLRRTDLGANAQQFLARVGVLANVGPGVRAGGGYAYVLSHDYGEFTPEGTFPEHRLWQQLNLSHNSNAVAFLHRFRLEERWLGLPARDASDSRDWTFQWRARYMLRTVVPLHGAPTRAGRLYLFGSDELFVRWGASQPTNLFDQNRLQLGLGVSLAESLRLEASWLNVQLLRGDGSLRESGNGIVLSLTSNASLR